MELRRNSGGEGGACLPLFRVFICTFGAGDRVTIAGLYTDRFLSLLQVMFLVICSGKLAISSSFINTRERESCRYMESIVLLILQII